MPVHLCFVFANTVTVLSRKKSHRMCKDDAEKGPQPFALKKRKLTSRKIYLLQNKHNVFVTHVSFVCYVWKEELTGGIAASNAMLEAIASAIEGGMGGADAS